MKIIENYVFLNGNILQIHVRTMVYVVLAVVKGGGAATIFGSHFSSKLYKDTIQKIIQTTIAKKH